jgi:hypothetical protein
VTNLASQHLQLVAVYSNSCRNWFARAAEQHRALLRVDPAEPRQAA